MLFAGMTAVHTASSKGHLTVLKLLLEARGSADNKSWDGSRPLHCAVLNKHMNIIQLLVQVGPVDPVNRCGQTPLWIAANEGIAPAVEILLDEADSRLDIANECHNTTRDLPPCSKCCTNGLTAIHVACRKGHKQIVQLILERFGKQATQLLSSLYGDSPLHFAAEFGHSDIATLLIDTEADVRLENDLGQSALDVAAEAGHTQLVQLLVESGASIEGKSTTSLHEAASTNSCEAAEALIEGRARLDVWDAYQQTPLHVAAFHGHDQMAELLIKYNATIAAARGSDKWTALDCALSRNICDSHYGVITLLVKGHALDHSNQLSPVHVVCFQNSLRTLELLVKAGQPIDQPNSHGCTPHAIARSEGHMLLATWIEGWANSVGVDLNISLEPEEVLKPNEGSIERNSHKEMALADLQLLLDEGVITQVEFDAEKLFFDSDSRSPSASGSSPEVDESYRDRCGEEMARSPMLSQGLVDDLLNFSLQAGHADLLKGHASPAQSQKSAPKPKRQQSIQHQASQALFRDLHSLNQTQMISPTEFGKGKESVTDKWRAKPNNCPAPHYRCPPGWSRRRRIFFSDDRTATK